MSWLQKAILGSFLRAETMVIRATNIQYNNSTDKKIRPMEKLKKHWGGIIARRSFVYT